YAAVMASDDARSQVILFGGSQSGTVQDRTWAWNGNNWADITSSARPPPRYDFGMAYDTSRQQVVLFSGGGGIPPDFSDGIHDTWAWDGAWRELAPATAFPSSGLSRWYS